jgi:hypothetical protein
MRVRLHIKHKFRNNFSVLMCRFILSNDQNMNDFPLNHDQF